MNKHYKDAVPWCKDVEISNTALKNSKMSQLLIHRFLKLILPICRIFIPNEEHETVSNKDFFKKLYSQYSATILETVIPLTRDIIKDLHDVSTAHIKNEDIKDYLDGTKTLEFKEPIKRPRKKKQ